MVDAAHRRGPRARGCQRPARPRARLPVARAQHADAVAGRAAAAAAGDAGALEPVRRRLRARRAVGRAASRRHRGAAARARPAEGGGQFAVRRRARARRDPPRRLDRGRRPGGRRARRPRSSTAARRTGCAQVEASQTRRLSVRRRAASPRATPRRPRGWLRLAGVTRNNLDDLDVAFPLGVFTTRHRRLRLGQVEPGQPGARRAGRRRSSGTRSAGEEDEKPTSSSAPSSPTHRRPDRRRHGAIKRLVRRRSEADRPDAAVEPRDLHRAVRPRPQAVRGDEGREARATTTPAGSRSTSPRAAARPARAKAS